MSWFFISYQEQIIDTGKQPIFLLLTGLIASFLFIRMSTRLIRAGVSWWPGNVSAGPVHLHHEMFGVILLLACGIASFAVGSAPPWRDVFALGFGIGAGLVLDEFALLLYLKDVYWSKEGRTSISAVVLATTATVILLLGLVPFGLDGISGTERATRWAAVGIVLANLCGTVVTALKGKVWLAVISVVVPLVGIVCAVRLARPNSPWARWRYGVDSRRMQRSGVRDARWNRRKRLFFDTVAGRPTQSSTQP